MRIAIVGWGSLLWDKHEWFDSKHEDWQEGGPVLPIEFTRVSKSRGGILTPVIDPLYGESCPTAYCLSKRVDYMDTICDLRQREGTLWKYISRVHKWGHNCRYIDHVYVPVYKWMQGKNIDVVIWTGIESNFYEKVGRGWSAPRAIGYINGLPREAKEQWDWYLSNLPGFVTTPFLTAYEQMAENIESKL